MAVAGALIVFAGLVILSTVISQLYKVLDFFEDLVKRAKTKKYKVSDEKAAALSTTQQMKPERFPDDLDSIVSRYKSVSASLGNTFPLVDLYRLAREIDAPHPHLTISQLRQQHFLIPQGDGIFSWRQ
jgi:hypothetical protein